MFSMMMVMMMITYLKLFCFVPLFLHPVDVAGQFSVFGLVIVMSPPFPPQTLSPKTLKP